MNFHDAALDMKALRDHFHEERETLVSESLGEGLRLCETYDVDVERRARRKKQMPGEKSKGEALTAKQETERVMKCTLDRLHSEIDQRFTRLQDTDLKFGFLLDINKLCYSEDKNELKTNCNTFGNFYSSDVNAQDLYEEILDCRLLLSRRIDQTVSRPEELLKFIVEYERSREPHLSFGAVCAGAVDVSIASGEATDDVFVVGFVVTDGALNPTGLEVEGTSLVCVVPWLLPRFTGAFGGAVFKEGGAAEAAPPMGACGVCPGTLGVVQGIAENRSGGEEEDFHLRGEDSSYRQECVSTAIKRRHVTTAACVKPTCFRRRSWEPGERPIEGARFPGRETSGAAERQQRWTLNDESESDKDATVVFYSSSEEDSDDVFTDSDSEGEDSSDDTMASSREWFRIDLDNIPARPPRFDFRGFRGLKITISYKKIFQHLLDEATYNSFVLYQKGGGRASHLEYRLRLIDEIITKYSPNTGTKKKGRPGRPLNATRFGERHFPSHIPPTEKKQEPTRRCVVCYMKRDVNGKNIRKETRTWCRWCEKALCAVPCFERYHTDGSLN
ncbi:hypothetical protein HPB51_024627 [Rhipicephalus microplus]|uniref:PiggyBac transposable element-derived protein 4 C-terminal zinc-finger domain-containing protein n=1 Tax=Rhipicephalus microplus TaxID=6941 RepID=A0A9J6F865_RHIMP|nr:hypothetical protein HPB51_024627 [Rhipicephalus microplus]